MLLKARRASGLSQDALASRAGTSRPTLSAYERGRKSPSLSTTVRILGKAGFGLQLVRRVEFVERAGERGRTILVPTSLSRLSVAEAMASVVLPLHLNWSAPGRRFVMRDRRQRARVYELVLREGTPNDVLAYVDGALLMDLWDELVLPPSLRSAWAPLVQFSNTDLVA